MKKVSQLLVVIALLLVSFSQLIMASDTYEEPELFKGEIIEIVSDETMDTETSGGTYSQRIQLARVELLNKGRKGEIIEITNYIDEIMAYTIEINPGDDVYIFFEKDDEGNEIAAHIHEFRRDKDIYFLVGIFEV